MPKLAEAVLTSNHKTEDNVNLISSSNLKQ